MSIPFTQYLRPNGREEQVTIDRPPHIEKIAKEFIDSGGYFECEELTTGHASLTAGHKNHPDGDIAIELCMNGPTVPHHVDRLVEKAARWLRYET